MFDKLADLLDQQNEDTNHDNADDIDHSENEADDATVEQFLRYVSIGCIFKDKGLKHEVKKKYVGQTYFCDHSPT